MALITTSVVHAAPSLLCRARWDGASDGNNGAFLIGENMEADCSTKINREERSASVYFFGVGPGLRISDERFILSCPLVRKSKMNGAFYGIKVAAVAGIGAHVGVFTNQRLGVCVLTGVDIGVGAEVTIGKMEVNIP